MYIVAVTSCPMGVAQTYMAAEILIRAFKEKGVICKVETQGFLGPDNEITYEDLEQAEGCVLTTDMPIIDRERFEGLPIIETSIKNIIKDSNKIVSELLQRLGQD